uniref:Secreted protein n=1 Tax=Steinernema glaseri TaxID=37863 RepID=A0A1I7YKQ4_9BILA
MSEYSPTIGFDVLGYVLLGPWTGKYRQSPFFVAIDKQEQKKAMVLVEHRCSTRCTCIKGSEAEHLHSGAMKLFLIVLLLLSAFSVPGESISCCAGRGGCVASCNIQNCATAERAGAPAVARDPFGKSDSRAGTSCTIL